MRKGGTETLLFSRHPQGTGHTLATPAVLSQKGTGQKNEMHFSKKKLFLFEGKSQLTERESDKLPQRPPSAENICFKDKDKLKCQQTRSSNSPAKERGREFFLKVHFRLLNPRRSGVRNLQKVPPSSPPPPTNKSFFLFPFASGDSGAKLFPLPPLERETKRFFKKVEKKNPSENSSALFTGGF